jgi:glutathionylspermidine synthase
MNRRGSSAIEGDSAHPAIEDLHEYLQANPGLAADSHEMLMRLSVERLMTFGGRPFSRYLRPHLITRAQHEAITQVVRSLASAFVKLRRAMLHDPKGVSPGLVEQLDLTPQELHLAMIDPGFEEPSPSARLDSFWSERDWRFVEMNAESPASIAYCDVLSETFLELPAMRGWMEQRGYRLRPLPARDRFMQEIEDTYREFRSNRGAELGFNERPNIAIVDWDGVPTYTEFELFKQYFEERGLKTIITNPESLEFSGGRLRVGDFPIDIFYKRVLTSELLSKPEVAAPTLRAYEAGAICVINNFRAKLLHKKMSLALLHDDANAHLFSQDELAAIRNHIPWTRKVAEGYTNHEGERIDLVPYIARNRERLVIKPNDEYGGKGVAIGWDTSEEEWQRTIEEALRSSYVVQEAVTLDREPYPYFEEGSLAFREVTADLDPFVFGTETQGILTRLSAASLLNVTAGTGSVVPTMVVEKL